MPSTFLARQEVQDYNDAAEQHNKQARTWNASTVKGGNGKPLVVRADANLSEYRDYLQNYGAPGRTEPLKDLAGQPVGMDDLRGAQLTARQMKNGQTIGILQKAVNGVVPNAPSDFKMEDPTAGMTLQELKELEGPQEEQPGLIQRLQQQPSYFRNQK